MSIFIHFLDARNQSIGLILKACWCFCVYRVYNPNSGLDLLRVVQASKDQCIQRMGRAGREEPGTCYRLFTEREFERFRDNTMPEIQRCVNNISLMFSKVT